MLGVIGDVVQDIVVWQLEPTRYATDTRSEVHNRRGGSAANVAAFAGPRYPTRFLGCVGDDPAGLALRRELEGHGVDVRLQVRDKTGVIVVLIDEHGERLMFPSRAASRLIERVGDDDLEGIELLHCPLYAFQGGTTPDAARDAIARVHAAGGEVAVDASSVGLIEDLGVDVCRDLLADLQPDIVSADREECALLGLTAHGAPGPMLTRLPETTLLARCGSEPTVVHRPGHEPFVVPVPRVGEIKDLTGAGDAFNAGFFAAYLTGKGVVQSCREGHALAARVLRHPGATEGEPVPCGATDRGL